MSEKLQQRLAALVRDLQPFFGNDDKGPKKAELPVESLPSPSMSVRFLSGSRCNPHQRKSGSEQLTAAFATLIP
jgi:hypothetical protein